MAGRVDARLKELGIVLPKPAAVQGAYVPWVKSATFLFVSGQITMGPNGLEYAGTLGLDMNAEFGRKAGGEAPKRWRTLEDQHSYNADV